MDLSFSTKVELVWTRHLSPHKESSHPKIQIPLLKGFVYCAYSINTDCFFWTDPFFSISILLSFSTVFDSGTGVDDFNDQDDDFIQPSSTIGDTTNGNTLDF